LGYLRSGFCGCAGEEAVDEGVGGRVERRQRLDEGGERQVGLRARHLPKHLQQVEHDVRTPAPDEHFPSKQFNLIPFIITWIQITDL